MAPLEESPDEAKHGAKADGSELTARIGWREPFQNPTFSEGSLQRAAGFIPRPTDVFITTAPKTGTTWLQAICHALRTGGLQNDFEDIYQVSPWDQLAWDLGQDLNAEQSAKPRIFKTHVPLCGADTPELVEFPQG
eukprot:TRINITY_DN30475_c0_g1_i1.p2 TRINITY_DN30475_c0_g1~~TRINITY_DN30475_c0_g1_i1.p2  ORF type:complete len:136 (+),score=36.10 TRINITY_DN30475_c0_g1_i1:114-521(+)